MGVSSHSVIDGAAVFATSVPMLALRLFGSVALLLAVGYAAVSVARRRRAPSGRGKARPITVRGRLGLTRRSSIVLISVGERNLLIGVTDSAVNVVAEGNDLHVEVPDSLDTPSSFGDALSVALRDRFGGSSQ
ncbi:MAG: flagellar biosynthetic protein FliO [Ilumatobacteraceae bacterium]|nr:flagellar biosynthetic protein FliO [Ilumatobacteraceae bacterium]